MKRSAGIRIAGILAMAAGFSVGLAPAAWSGKAAKPAPVRTVTLRVFHRVFHDFSEDDKVMMNEEFPIGDTDFSATVFRYEPDFVAVSDSTYRVIRVSSRSNEPNNPAFQIAVKQNGVAQDTVWAFLNMEPHFARKSMLAFQIRRIEFNGHSTIVNRDKPPASPSAGAPHGTTGRKSPGAPTPAAGPTSRPDGGR